MTQTHRLVAIVGFYGFLIIVSIAIGSWLYDRDPTLANLWSVVVGMTAIVILWQSFYALREDARLVLFFLSTRTSVYVSGTYANKNGVRRDFNEHRGLFGFDIVIAWWPLYRGYYLPTEGTKTHLNATEAWDKNNVPMLIDTTLYLQLRGDPDPLIISLGLTRRVFGNDLARSKKLYYRGIETQEFDEKTRELKVKQMEYEGPVISEHLCNLLQEVVDSAILRAAAKNRTYRELLSNQEEFAQDVQDELTPKNQVSLFTTAGIFNGDGSPGPAITYQSEEEVRRRRRYRPENDQYIEGLAMLAIERITPRAMDLVLALSKPAQAKHEADADAELGRGRGEHMANIRKKAGISREAVVAQQMLERANANITFVVSNGLLDAVSGKLLGDTPKRKKEEK